MHTCAGCKYTDHVHLKDKLNLLHMMDGLSVYLENTMPDKYRYKIHFQVGHQLHPVRREHLIHINLTFYSIPILILSDQLIIYFITFNFTRLSVLMTN